MYSDLGRQYISETWRNYLNTKGIEFCLNSAYNPRENGISDRLNQFIGFAMKLYDMRDDDEL
ncbi:hypothetical protein HERIO_2489 [Hepatospora eriocheir]|uniref:Integrase catalytic domain-containing protein n=1 Tax=Hepatospora eriocheir TaxID=1081669 RepID=A0A1X0Q6T1_9MICR|nr:hypothetical protein HERIO_2489 [Hepatospora eriocheir]